MSYQRTNLTDAINDLTTHVGNNTVFWGSEEKADATREALCVWQVMVGEFTHSINIPADGSTFYNTPKQIMSIQRLLLDGVPLVLTSLPELDHGNPGWEATTGTAFAWGPNGVNEFFLYPKPSSGIITVHGLRDTFRPFAGSDWIDLGEEELTSILGYGHHYLTFKEGGVELDSSISAMGELIAAAGTRNKRLAETALYKKFMGKYRDEGLRPPRAAGDPSIGARL